MKNIINYVLETNRSFKREKFNAVDSLVLSQLAYLNFDGLLPGLWDSASPVSIQEVIAMKNLDVVFQDDAGKGTGSCFLPLQTACGFRDTKLGFYMNQLDDKAEKQFSAVTFLLGDGSSYIAYRGTDTTFVGWKEDFNMASSARFHPRKKELPI